MPRAPKCHGLRPSKLTAREREIARRLAEPNVDEAWASAYIREEAARIRARSIAHLRSQPHVTEDDRAGGDGGAD
jgi:hypothetical protein